MMNRKSSRQWIEAAKLLGVDPSQKVYCPECGMHHLEVLDAENPNHPLEFERYLHCPSCKAVNIMRKRRI